MKMQEPFIHSSILFFISPLRCCSRSFCRRINFYILFTLVSISALSAFSQPPVKYDIFNRSPLVQVEIRLPQPATFQTVSISSFNSRSNQTVIPDPIIKTHKPGTDVWEQNRRLLAQHEVVSSDYRRAEIMAEAQRDFTEMEINKEYREWLAKSAVYRETFEQMNKMYVDSFSLTKAVFLVENAFLDNKLSYPAFIKGVQLRAEHAKQIIRREKLDMSNNVALNYGIQKLFSQPNAYYNSQTKQSQTIPAFRYAFEDFRGEKDYTNVFASKMLATNKGQCHSMPLVYLMIAEQLGAKAWLSLAPQHSFIQFMDSEGQLTNYETTNGNLVSATWLVQSGFVSAQALQSKTYLDTLSQQNLYAQCLADLLLGYIKKFRYDDFAEHMRQRILQLNPQNMTALMVDAQIKTKIALHKINAAGKPKPEDLPQYPEAYGAYLEMHESYERIDGLGYQDMPPEAYQKWLKSIEQEKKKHANKEIQERLQREIEHMKKNPPRSIIINNTKG